jgi:hypothetical protein
LVTRFCLSDPKLQAAVRETFSPPEDRKKLLWRRRDEPLPDGFKAPEDGYYCNICGGFIGKDDDEAGRNGWTCQIHPDHYFGPEL